MNISSVIKQYFNNALDVSIDVFDGVNIYAVYQRVIGVLTQHMDIETTMLQALSYCFYEILDNVLTHSGKIVGTVLTQYDAEQKTLRILVADDGIGIHQSLSEDQKYKDISEAEALLACIKDSVTDGKGMGFGLYSTALLVKTVGVRFEIHSGYHQLILRDGEMSVEEAEKWQGTKVFMELQTNKEIDPNQVVSNRTDCAAQYNGIFLDTKDLDELW